MHSVPEHENEHRASEQPSKPGLLAEALYRFLPALMLAAVLLRPVGVSDLGWQLRLGGLMDQYASPFVREQFVANHIGEQLTPNAWLAQLAFYQVWSVWGLVGLRALDALLWMGGLLAVTIATRRRVDRPLAVVFALIVAFVVALPSASIRPQSFASLAFGLTLILIRSSKPLPVTLALGALLFVAWQNFHPSVSLAALIIGIIAATKWYQHLTGSGDRPWNLSALALLAAASVFCTPAGTGILQLARYNTEASLYYGATEWFPLWSPVNRAFLFTVAVSAATACVAILKNRRHISPEEAIPFLVTLILAIFAARFILFYSISIIPILSWIKFGSFYDTAGRTRLRKFSVVSWLVCAGELLIAPITVEKDIPVAALKELNSVAGNGTIFCDPAFGGVLVYAGFPHRRVAFDGRFYLYSIPELSRFKDTRYNPNLLFEIDRIYHPIGFALAPIHSLALIRELRAHPQIWSEIHRADDAVFFIRSSVFEARRPDN